jgi:hypothetical protein
LIQELPFLLSPTLTERSERKCEGRNNPAKFSFAKASEKSRRSLKGEGGLNLEFRVSETEELSEAG